MDLVDAFHVGEYVQKAADAIEGADSADARILATTWRETLKEREDGAATVLRSMRARLSRVEGAGRRKETVTAIGYIANVVRGLYHFGRSVSDLARACRLMGEGAYDRLHARGLPMLQGWTKLAS